jgi:[acyl-carrier-protein] S-malonyltransferase
VGDTVALLFPGQGSQQPGMGQPWRHHAAFGRWAEAEAVLGEDLTRLALTADADELRRPRACQLALFVHGVVLAEAWQDTTGAAPVALAGHSLGEYVALVVAEAVSFADALSLVEVRARACEAAADAEPGGLTACLGVERELLEAACERAGAHIANDNAPGQIVVAGRPDALARVRSELAPASGKVVDVDVGAAYHSPLMQPAVEPLRAALEATPFTEHHQPVVANVDATPHTRGAGWPDRLAAQIVSPVRWRETIERLRDDGVSCVVELGASTPLSSMVKRTDRTLSRHPVTVPDDLPSPV